MSHPKELQNTNDPDFDPTLDESDGGSSEDALDPMSAPLAFAHVPGEGEIAQVVSQFFGSELPESLRAIIASESNEIAHSTRKILEEHLRIGGILFNLRSRIEGHFVATLGEKKACEKQGRGTVLQVRREAVPQKA